MPTLEPQPSDALLDRLMRLEREVRESRTVRRRPAHNCKAILDGGGQSVTSGSSPETIILPDLVYENPAGSFDDVAGEWTCPSDGLYLVICAAYITFGSPVPQTQLIFSEIGEAAPEGNYKIDQGISGVPTTPNFSVCTPILAGQVWGMSLSTSQTVSVVNAALTIQRLSDFPANADQPT